MDSNQPKTPDFTLDPSPPNFSYDFHPDSSGSPGTGGFEAFTGYGGFPDTSPRLGGFSALALGTSHSANPNFFSTQHMYSHPHHNPGGSPTAHSFTSASTNSAGRPLTPLEGHDLATISPNLTLSPTQGHSHGHPGNAMYHQALSSSEMDSMEDPGTTSPTARGQVRDGGRSSTNSPPSSVSASASQGYSSAHMALRSQRYNPMAPHQSQSQGTGVNTRTTRPAARRSATATRRSLRRDDDDLSDEEGDGMGDDQGSIGMDVGVSSSDIIQRRREEIRRQRIESEQRRRDELRDGYAKLKYALPISNQKSSKVSLLDRAVTYIRQLETNQSTLQTRLDNAENELTRLRNVNEQLMRNLADQHRAVTLSALAAANAQASASASQASSQTASEPPSPAGNKKIKSKSSF